jgi:hypothetical protein
LSNDKQDGHSVDGGKPQAPDGNENLQECCHDVSQDCLGKHAASIKLEFPPWPHYLHQFMIIAIN